MGKRNRSNTKNEPEDPQLSTTKSRSSKLSIPDNTTITTTTTTTVPSSSSSSSSTSSSSKRKTSIAATTLSSSSTGTPSDTVETIAPRPKRQAMLQAKENIHQQLENERSSASDNFYVSSSSSSSNVQRGRSGSSSIYSSMTDRSGTVNPSKLASIPSSHLSFVPIESTGKICYTPELYTAALPTRNKTDGMTLHFKDYPDFLPNLTPEEVLRRGSFGGYYYRPIASQVTGLVHYDNWREFPDAWFKNVPSIKNYIVSPIYDPTINTYKVSSGQDLRDWEESNWITAQDPYGWFQWYCRFYLGRRTEDDERQIGRWKALAGITGRWKNNLIAKCVQQHRSYDDISVSPVVRQTLQHWAYSLTEKDYQAYARKLGTGSNQGTAFIRRNI